MRPHVQSLRLFLAVLLIVLGGAVPATAAGSGGAHCLIALAEYTKSSVGPFYFGGEGQDTQFSIVEIPHYGCESMPPAGYSAVDDTAVNGNDFALPPGEVNPRGDATVPVPLLNDSLTEPAIEVADILVVADVAVAQPARVPLYVVDADGADRVTLFKTTAMQAEGRSQVWIPVFRAGPAAGLITVGYSISPDSATAGLDYEAPSEGTLSFAAGVRMQFIEFTIKEDALAESNESLQVTLLAGTGYELEPSASLVLTILDNEESIPPESKFHHPKQGWTYKRSDYRIREMHVFARDEGGAEVAEVQMALRKKKTDGSCRWWNEQTGTWDPGACSELRWMTMSFLSPYSDTWPELYDEDFPGLSPSIGTAVRNYTAWSRAIDGAGNVEALPFVKGRNWNTFEVKRG
jgi:hypothetical protein